MCVSVLDVGYILLTSSLCVAGIRHTLGRRLRPNILGASEFIVNLQATRWDNYLHIFDPRIHWFSLVNSLVIVVFLCVMVSMILLRSVSRDVRNPYQLVLDNAKLPSTQISRYNAIDLSVCLLIICITLPPTYIFS